MRALVIDKGCLCNSIFHYPVNMVFFTTPELLEIGDLPLVSPNEKPTRVEALKYYRRAAEHYELELRCLSWWFAWRQRRELYCAHEDRERGSG